MKIDKLPELGSWIILSSIDTKQTFWFLYFVMSARALSSERMVLSLTAVGPNPDKQNNVSIMHAIDTSLNEWRYATSAEISRAGIPADSARLDWQGTWTEKVNVGQSIEDPDVFGFKVRTTNPNVSDFSIDVADISDGENFGELSLGEVTLLSPEQVPIEVWKHPAVKANVLKLRATIEQERIAAIQRSNMRVDVDKLLDKLMAVEQELAGNYGVDIRRRYFDAAILASQSCIDDSEPV